MPKFLLKSGLFILIMFFCVLLGMQEANEGLINMKGYEDPSLQSAFQIGKNESGEVEAAILGEDVDSQYLLKKEKQLEEYKSFNIFSSIGTKLAEWITSFFQSLLSAIVALVDRLLDGFS